MSSAGICPILVWDPHLCKNLLNHGMSNITMDHLGKSIWTLYAYVLEGLNWHLVHELSILPNSPITFSHSSHYRPCFIHSLTLHASSKEIYNLMHEQNYNPAKCLHNTHYLATTLYYMYSFWCLLLLFLLAVMPPAPGTQRVNINFV